MFNKLNANKKVLVSGVLCNGEPFRNIVMEVVDKNGNEVLLLDSKNILHTALLADDKNVVFDNEYCTFVTKVALKEPNTRLDVVYESKLHNELDQLSLALKQRTVEDTRVSADVVRKLNEGNKHASRLYMKNIVLNALLMKELEGYGMQQLEVKFDKLLAPENEDVLKVLYAPTGIGAINEEMYFGLKEDLTNIPMLKITTPDKKVIDVEKLERKALSSLHLSRGLSDEELIENAAKQAYKILGIKKAKNQSYLLGDFTPEMGDEE